MDPETRADLLRLADWEGQRGRPGLLASAILQLDQAQTLTTELLERLMAAVPLAATPSTDGPRITESPTMASPSDVLGWELIRLLTSASRRLDLRDTESGLAELHFEFADQEDASKCEEAIHALAVARWLSISARRATPSSAGSPPVVGSPSSESGESAGATDKGPGDAPEKRQANGDYFPDGRCPDCEHLQEHHRDETAGCDAMFCNCAAIWQPSAPEEHMEPLPPSIVKRIEEVWEAGKAGWPEALAPDCAPLSLANTEEESSG